MENQGCNASSLHLTHPNTVCLSARGFVLIQLCLNNNKHIKTRYNNEFFNRCELFSMKIDKFPRKIYL